jgi:2-polyprenylphenol hydroxylase and related flavodoxin oxidoreductases
MPRVKQFEAEIVENRAVAEDWRELILPWKAEAPSPGQFLTLRISPYSDPLLRRPFAFSAYEAAREGREARASIVYQLRGGATRLLSELAAGASIDALGPLGRPFSLPQPGERPILAAGGVGLGPLLFLASALRSVGRRAASGSPPLLVLGFRSAGLAPELDLPEGSVLCTDDGSSGLRGTPVDWISANVPASRNVRLYGCGPAPMLAALARLSAERGWHSELSAEAWMACGVGACMGCALPRSGGGGYLRACADGPVFDATAIDWEACR